MTDPSPPRRGTLSIGLLAFPRITQLDLTGPYEVFSRMKDVRLQILWKTLDPVRSDAGFAITPTTTLDDCPQLDIVVVPGGPGVQPLMEDEAVLGFLVRQAPGCRWVMSVCTGSLVLAAAGLLDGLRATCHWNSLPLLAEMGAVPTAERVVIDGNRISTAGVSAGIDGALRLAAEIDGEEAACRIQLMIEYDPDPPFRSGSPATAHPALVERIRSATAELQAQRVEVARRAARRLAEAKAS